MSSPTNRRDFLLGGGAATAGLLASGTAASVHGQDHLAGQEHQKGTGHGHPVPNGAPGGSNDRGKLVAGFRAPGQPPVPVEMPDGPATLDWKMVDGVKEFHLTAEHLKKEVLPDVWIDVWGYNGSMPGPMIEVVEGDRVRVIVHNKLPEPTIMHWHGIEVPNSMDGVEFLTQDPIEPGESFAYEFTLTQNGTFAYHTHVAMQQGMGMVGPFIVHPKVAYDPPVDRDIVLIIQEWAILPGSTIHNTMSMEFNLFTLNGRAAPYITPIVVKQGDRVRIRFFNFSAIDHHPMHLHGLTFWITGTEAGRIPDTAWIPSNNVLVAVAQARDVEFIANNPGDWVFHCHMFHHMMNFMSSMVGPMGGHTQQGLSAGGGMATGMGMITRGPALSSEFGAQLGRGTGEQTGSERAVGNRPTSNANMNTHDTMQMPGNEDGEAPHAGHGDAATTVPGFPQSMAGMMMRSEKEIAKLNSTWQTRGLRKEWFGGVEGLMTMVRVLPPDLYDRVVSGEDVPAGVSVPGATPGKEHDNHKKH